MENKNVEIETETSLVTLPKMEFVFDSAKITPAKIDKDMIDFEKAEQKVEEIEKLYNIVFNLQYKMFLLNLIFPKLLE